jgi:hypothetical protein
VARLADLPPLELYDHWLRALTILTDPADMTAADRGELLRRANHPRAISLEISDPPTAEDAAALAAALEDLSKLRLRENVAHARVTLLLLGWLSDATGANASEIITRLAVTTNCADPPDGSDA